MANQNRSFRRVVTGNDSWGRSKVLYDGPSPNSQTYEGESRTGIVQHWCFKSMPTDLSGNEDLGLPPFISHPPQHGAFFRFVSSRPAPPEYNPNVDPNFNPPHDPVVNPETGHGDRGGGHLGRGDTHRTRSIDYGIVTEGSRTLILDDSEVELNRGDAVIQLASYHAWSNITVPSVMSFIMIGATFDE